VPPLALLLTNITIGKTEETMIAFVLGLIVGVLVGYAIAKFGVKATAAETVVKADVAKVEVEAAKIEATVVADAKKL
jgi:uncharacterized membrane-anchored protein YhcB (DUF1043 family)